MTQHDKVDDLEDRGNPRIRLSPREAEVMENISRGLLNDEIAREMFVSKKTVKNHINRLFAKLGARHRAEAVAIWLGAVKPLSVFDGG
jgi:DNA-binding NarL/FixJ family response regulator